MKKITPNLITSETNLSDYFLVQGKTDQLIERFIIFFFIFGVLLCPIYQTWTFGLAVGGLNLLLYGVAKFAISNKFASRMVISVVLAIFVLQYIGQLHGMAELHFFFFTNIALLILYQDWRLILPYTILTVLHHTLLAFFQWYLGMDNLAQYFISYTNITLLQMAFHFGIVSLMAYIAILWAVMLRNNSMKLLAMQQEMAVKNEKLTISETQLQAALANTEQEVQRKTAHLQTKTEELLAAEEELRQNLEEISATQEQLQQTNLAMEVKMLAINTTVGYMELGVDKTILEVNEMLATALGYKTVELVNQKHSVLVSKEVASSESYQQLWNDLINGKIISQEFERRSKTGKTVWINASYCPVKDEKGQVTKIAKLAIDITAQKERERELILLETLIDNSTDAFQAATDNGKIMYMNRVGRERLGLQKEQLKNLWVRDYEKLFEKDGTWEAHAAEMKELKQLTIQSINHDKSRNRDFPVEVSIRHLTIEGQGYLMATSRDITERVKAEAALRESEAFQQRIFEYSPVPTVVMDVATFKYIDCNEACVKVYGFGSKEATLGKTPLDVSAPIQYDGTPSSEKAIGYINQAMQEGYASFEWLQQRPDGSQWDSDVHLLLFTSGERQFFQFSLIDKTERKKAEAEIKQLSMVASKTSNAVVITDSTGHITWVNESFVSITGYTFAEVAGKKPGHLLQGKDTNPAHVQKIREGLASKKSFTQEILNYNKQGVPYWLELNITPVLNAAGEVEQFFGIEVDITERKAISEKLEQQNEQLLNSEQILQQNMQELQEVQKYLTEINEQLETNQREIELKNEELASSEEELKQNLEELSATQEKLQGIYEEVQEKEAQIRRLLNALPNCVFDSKLNTKTGQYEIEMVNDTVETIYGIRPEQVKENPLVLTTLLNEEENQRVNELMTEGMQRMQPFNMEYRITKANGKKPWLYSHVIPELLPDGNIRLTSVVTDITDRKRAELAIQQQYELLQTNEEELRQNLEELNATQEQLQNQYNVLATKDKNIADSINYALRIQNALLPRLADIQAAFPESFVLFRPRDVISGDFYWFADKGTEQIMVAADCTGHGVPGAFMSMLGSSLINQIVHDKEIHSPDSILNLLHQGIETMLDQRNAESNNRDGMDASICVVDRSKKLIHYAGANNSIFVLSKKDLQFKMLLDEETTKIDTCETMGLAQDLTDWQLTDIKPDKKSAGGRVNKKIDDTGYTLRTFALDQPLKIYMFSDGYADQIGGEHRRKIQSKGLKSLILQYHDKKADEQKELFNNYFVEWTKTTGRQFDDVMMLGFNV